MSKSPVDDRQVVRIYTSAMAEAAAHGLSGIPQIAAAFRSLKKKRDEPGMSTDLNLAAAEWFAFARYGVATGFVSKTQMRALSYSYYAKKIFHKHFGNPNADAVTSNPVSEPSNAVANWGMAGAKRGEADHAALEVKASPPFWRSVDSIMGEDKGGYRSIGAAQ